MQLLCKPLIPSNSMESGLVALLRKEPFTPTISVLSVFANTPLYALAKDLSIRPTYPSSKEKDYTILDSRENSGPRGNHSLLTSFASGQQIAY